MRRLGHRVSRNPSPETRSKEAQSTGQRVLLYLFNLLVMGLVILMWFELGPDNALYGLLVASWTLNLGLLATPLALRLPAKWFQVQAGERLLHNLEANG